jgi:hypothetical protein
MPNLKTAYFYISILFLTLCSVQETFAILPMQGYHDLVAGQGTGGLKNGPFYDALFNTPKGLALSSDGKDLYIADEGNHCVRVIDLDNGNDVSTLVGTGSPGYTDGNFSVATFHNPCGLVVLPNQQIAVWDSGNACIRLIDIDKKTVSTLAGTGSSGNKDSIGNQSQIDGIWNMVYFPSQDSIYFTQPDFGALRAIDLKTRKVLTVFTGSAGQPLPHPGAICAAEGKLYIADRQETQVYELSLKNPALTIGRDAFNWTLVSPDSKILALTWSDGSLYGLRNDPANPVTRLYPNPHPVAFISPWSADPNHDPLEHPFWADLQVSDNISFIADPRSARKFYIVNPVMNIITSFRDLSFDELKVNESLNQKGLMDFEYPVIKPKNTYRILMVGDSHLFHDFHTGGNTQNRMELTSKRLEFMLNTEAALDDVPIHFEVLTRATVSWESLNRWPNYYVPPLVKDYDIDLVIIELIKNFNLDDYFQRPLTDEGVPTEKIDPVFLLEHWPKKSNGTIAEKFLELCLKNNLATITSSGQPSFSDVNKLIQNPVIRDDMVEMYSRPLNLLNRKLTSSKTSSGHAVRMEVFLMPTAGFESNINDPSSFWQSILDKIGAPSVNLSSTMTALRISYYPFTEPVSPYHFDANGHLLISYLLAHHLIQDKIIPWK